MNRDKAQDKTMDAMSFKLKQLPFFYILAKWPRKKLINIITYYAIDNFSLVRMLCFLDLASLDFMTKFQVHG